MLIKAELAHMFATIIVYVLIYILPYYLLDRIREKIN